MCGRMNYSVFTVCAVGKWGHGLRGICCTHFGYSAKLCCNTVRLKIYGKQNGASSTKSRVFCEHCHSYVDRSTYSHHRGKLFDPCIRKWATDSTVGRKDQYSISESENDSELLSLPSPYSTDYTSPLDQ